MRAFGIYLNKPVFAHGQLYCAMSRATQASHVRLFARKFEQDQEVVVDGEGNRSLRTLNIVNRVFLHGNQRVPQATSPAPSPASSQAHSRNALPIDRPSAAETGWEQAAASCSLPEVDLRTKHPPVPSEKWDGTADSTKQVPCPASHGCEQAGAKAPPTADSIADPREIMDDHVGDNLP